MVWGDYDNASKGWQGGPYFIVHHAKGPNSLKHWKVTPANALNKDVHQVYDKNVRGYVCVASCNGTKLQLPKGGAKSIALVQPFLALQIRLSRGAPFSVQLSVTDAAGVSRRLHFSTSFKELKTSPLNTQIPLVKLIRESWVNLCIDVRDILASCFAGADFKSVDLVILTGCCKLRHLFTTQQPLVDSTITNEQPGRFQLPRTLDFPASAAAETQVYDAHKLFPALDLPVPATSTSWGMRMDDTQDFNTNIVDGLTTARSLTEKRRIKGSMLATSNLSVLSMRAPICFSPTSSRGNPRSVSAGSSGQLSRERHAQSKGASGAEAAAPARGGAISRRITSASDGGRALAIAVQGHSKSCGDGTRGAVSKVASSAELSRQTQLSKPAQVAAPSAPRKIKRFAAATDSDTMNELDEAVDHKPLVAATQQRLDALTPAWRSNAAAGALAVVDNLAHSQQTARDSASTGVRFSVTSSAEDLSDAGGAGEPSFPDTLQCRSLPHCDSLQRDAAAPMADRYSCCASHEASDSEREQSKAPADELLPIDARGASTAMIHSRGLASRPRAIPGAGGGLTAKEQPLRLPDASPSARSGSFKMPTATTTNVSRDRGLALPTTRAPRPGPRAGRSLSSTSRVIASARGSQLHATQHRADAHPCEGPDRQSTASLPVGSNDLSMAYWASKSPRSPRSSAELLQQQLAVEADDVERHEEAEGRTHYDGGEETLDDACVGPTPQGASELQPTGSDSPPATDPVRARIALRPIAHTRDASRGAFGSAPTASEVKTCSGATSSKHAAQAGTSALCTLESLAPSVRPGLGEGQQALTLGCEVAGQDDLDTVLRGSLSAELPQSARDAPAEVVDVQGSSERPPESAAAEQMSAAEATHAERGRCASDGTEGADLEPACSAVLCQPPASAYNKSHYESHPGALPQSNKAEPSSASGVVAAWQPLMYPQGSSSSIESSPCVSGTGTLLTTWPYRRSAGMPSDNGDVGSRALTPLLMSMQHLPGLSQISKPRTMTPPLTLPSAALNGERSGAAQRVPIVATEERTDMQDLVFDPMLNCYYDMHNNQYYSIE